MSLLNKIVGIVFITGCIVLGALFLLLIGTYIYYLPIVSSKENIMKNNDKGLTLLDDQGNEFFRFYENDREKYVGINDISKYAEEAAVSSEDREFYEHPGFSIRGIARSIVLDWKDKSINYGGSTITQQLVKNTLLTQNRNVIRKLQEIILAADIERRYSKDDIMEMYLNSSYFGEGAFGIEDASKKFFNKEANELSVGEASYLIGIMPAPTALSPYSGDQAAAKKRQELVLNEMEDLGYINRTQAQDAKIQRLVFVPPSVVNNQNLIAPHFALEVRRELIDKYGEQEVARSGYTVKTTLNRNWQERAQNAVLKNINYLIQNGGTNGAVVALDPKTGQVKAMVGSVDWNNDNFGKVNMATTPRQPGSSFKPIVYALALEDKQITPATVLKDVPTKFEMVGCLKDCEYKPHDYDNGYRGDVTVRRALSNSLNIPAVEVMEQVGINRVLGKASQIGITSLGDDTSKYGYSLVLGSGSVSLLQMTGAYGAFANNGKFEKPVLITSVINKRGEDIWNGSKNEYKAWSNNVAFLISSILSDNRTRSEMFGSSLTISRPAAVKTGTTDSYRDAWTIGYTPDVVVGVWVGNNNNKPMDNVAGSLGAAPIWRDLMQYYNRNVPVKQFSAPSGIVRLPPCSSSLANGEYFIKGTEPIGGCFTQPKVVYAATESASLDPEVSPVISPTSVNDEFN